MQVPVIRGRMLIAKHLSIYLSVICGSTPLVDLGRFFQFINLYTVGRTPWTGDQPSQGRCLHTEQHKQNKRTQTSVPRLGFEPTIPVFERTKTVLVLDRAVTVIGIAKPVVSLYTCTKH
jgi:hypothetical protein